MDSVKRECSLVAVSKNIRKMNVDKKCLQMITLSALICCFENVSIAKAEDYGRDTVCLPLTNEAECEKKSTCSWISDPEDLKRLGMNGKNCFEPRKSS